jgi:hypothetical protein
VAGVRGCEGEIVISDEEIERHRQAAYLYSIIQSAENSEGGGPETIPEKAFDAGILYAARCLLENWAGDTEWTVDLYEYADEIRSRTDPGHPLPQVTAYRYETPDGDEILLDPRDVTIIYRGEG